MNLVKESEAMKQEMILAIRNLSVYFYTHRGIAKAVNDISFEIPKGKTLALVGESGCGKTVTSLAIMRLIDKPGRIVGGQILFEGKNLLELSDGEIRNIRGNRISMIFQEPMTSLNPVFTVGDQIAEVFLTHEKISKQEAYASSLELLRKVRIPSPEKRIHNYPHQLSGGMQQRVMVAMALASPNPVLMIADEPTTALDVTIQAQIIELVKALQEDYQMSLLLITHDMGVVAETADMVAVMYAGKKVEEADVGAIFSSPRHPYTIGLLDSIPAHRANRDAERLKTIPGTVPSLIDMGEGCPFENRCRYAMPVCSREFPKERRYEQNHVVYCHISEELHY